MRGLAYWLYQPYKYFILVPLFVVDTIVFTFFTWIFSFFSARLSGKAAVAWAKIMQWLTPMPVKLIGQDNIDKKQSYVIVANHQGAYDIFAIYGSLPIDFRWVLKKELRDAPLLGFACEMCGHIFLDRSSSRAAYRSIQEAKAKLVDGTSVVIFPEGTRSGRAEMNAFKHGAFKLAFQLELPILPVTIKDSYKVMSGGLRTLSPGRVKLIVHKPIDTHAYKNDLQALIDATRGSIQEGLDNNE